MVIIIRNMNVNTKIKKFNKKLKSSLVLLKPPENFQICE